MIILRKPAKPQSQEIYRSGVVVADVLAGQLDGYNQTFNTTYRYKTDRISVFYNGQALHAPYDFEQTGGNEVKLLYVRPLPDENVRATYELEFASYGDSQRGQFVIPIGVSSYTVSFSEAFPDLDYTISAELVTSDGSPSVYSLVVGNKTAGGFTTFFSGVIDSNNYTLEWIAVT
jgi:hypothetical protein